MISPDTRAVVLIARANGSVVVEEFQDREGAWNLARLLLRAVSLVSKHQAITVVEVDA